MRSLKEAEVALSFIEPRGEEEFISYGILSQVVRDYGSLLETLEEMSRGPDPEPSELERLRSELASVRVYIVTYPWDDAGPSQFLDVCEEFGITDEDIIP